MEQQISTELTLVKPTKNILAPNVQVMGPILWAIDPNEDNERSIKKTVKTIEKWKGLFSEVHTVSMVFPKMYGWQGVKSAFPSRDIEFEVKKDIRNLLKLGNYQIHNNDVIFSPSDSRFVGVDLLLAYAKRLNASAIVVGSRAKRGQMTGLGSFAEVLLGKSPVPVIVVGKKATVGASKKILFPTDFSNSPKEAFKKLFEWAKRKNESILIYYQANFVGLPSYAGFVPGYEPRWFGEIWYAERTQKEKVAKEWVMDAVTEGVSCDYFIDNETGPLADRISNIVKERNIGLVAFGLKRNIWQQIFFGGDMRKVFSECKTPVIVFHSEPVL